MVFGVSEWPRNGDPRQGTFSFVGWAFGKVPPWKFLLSTTGALAPFDVFNTAQIFECIYDDGAHTEWLWTGPAPVTFICVISKDGQRFPVPPLDDWTVKISPIFDGGILDLYTGELRMSEPDAIQQLGPISMQDGGGSSAKIPNGVLITPHRWQ